MSHAVVRHAGPEGFLERASDWLLAAEDVNNLVLSLAYGLVTKGVEPDVLLATVETDGDVVGCSLRTPPHKLLVTEMGSDAARALVPVVAEAYETIPTVLGPDPAARAFAEEWASVRGCLRVPGMQQRIYRLDAVTPPVGVPGRLRRAEAGDLDLVADWAGGFARDTSIDSPDPSAMARRWIEQGRLHLWQDGEPVAMAVAHGRTPSGARIGFVYTPPALRGQGYASACVAAVSQLELDSGTRFCVLYTDLANPTSNALYQRLGYYPILDVNDYDFVTR